MRLPSKWVTVNKRKHPNDLVVAEASVSHTSYKEFCGLELFGGWCILEVNGEFSPSIIGAFAPDSCLVKYPDGTLVYENLDTGEVIFKAVYD